MVNHWLIIILAGGIPTPLKNDGVKVSWDDFPFPTEWKNDPNLPNHQLVAVASCK